MTQIVRESYGIAYAEPSDFKDVYESAFSFLQASKSFSDISLKKYLNIR